MGFKQWLLNEDFGDGGASWDLLYPTTGADYSDVNNNPLEHFWLQWKWDRGTDPDIGRVLHNIDNNDFQKRDYASIESRNMPGTDDGFWEHKPDDGSVSSIKPYKLPELRWVAMGKTSEETRFLDRDGAGKVKIWSGYGGPTSVTDDTDLDKIFHDEDRHTHRWPTIDEKKMDSDWAWPQHRARKLKESNLMEGDFLGSGFHVYPTLAPDWTEAIDSTKKIKLVKDRWEEEQDRLKFHNIDLESFKKIPFKSVNSRDIPDADDNGFWEHKPDDWRDSSLRVEMSPDLPSYGVADKADRELNVDGGPKTTHPFGFQNTQQPNHRLEQQFGDKHSGKFPEVDEDYVDSDWAWPQHKAELMESFKNWLEYGGGGGGATSAMHGGHFGLPYKTTNDNMPVRSKYTTSEQPPDKTEKRIKDGKVSTVDDEWGFKKRSIIGNEPSKERPSMWIDRKRRHLPTRNDAPDIVY